ncbi:MAG TPA: rhomboid family intramembrane serine protease [Thermoanaerobaculia bacterium]|nr:rhomboid family intramembrane serine protease [Thermoanaerobaculia bacterium]
MLPLRDLNPRRQHPPVITVALIAVNALMFFYELSLGERLEGFLMSAAFVPARLFDGQAVVPDMTSALLSMFLHGGWGHFLGNMLFLWIFGDNVEDRLGHVKYLIFYLLAGYAATFAHAFAGPHSTIPAIGASGAISGVLGAYLFLHPMARIVTAVWIFFFVRLIEVPAIVYLPLWFLIQAFSGAASLGAATAQDAGGVAWFAHIGGFVAGPLLLLILGGFRKPRG